MGYFDASIVLSLILGVLFNREAIVNKKKKKHQKRCQAFSSINLLNSYNISLDRAQSFSMAVITLESIVGQDFLRIGTRKGFSRRLAAVFHTSQEVISNQVKFCENKQYLENRDLFIGETRSNLGRELSSDVFDFIILMMGYEKDKPYNKDSYFSKNIFPSKQAILKFYSLLEMALKAGNTNNEEVKKELKEHIASTMLASGQKLTINSDASAIDAEMPALSEDQPHAQVDLGKQYTGDENLNDIRFHPSSDNHYNLESPFNDPNERRDLTKKLCDKEKLQAPELNTFISPGVCKSKDSEESLYQFVKIYGKIIGIENRDESRPEVDFELPLALSNLFSNLNKKCLFSTGHESCNGNTVMHLLVEYDPVLAQEIIGLISDENKKSEILNAKNKSESTVQQLMTQHSNVYNAVDANFEIKDAVTVFNRAGVVKAYGLELKNKIEALKKEIAGLLAENDRSEFKESYEILVKEYDQKVQKCDDANTKLSKFAEMIRAKLNSQSTDENQSKITPIKERLIGLFKNNPNGSQEDHACEEVSSASDAGHAVSDEDVVEFIKGCKDEGLEDIIQEKEKLIDFTAAELLYYHSHFEMYQERLKDNGCEISSPAESNSSSQSEATEKVVSPLNQEQICMFNLASDVIKLAADFDGKGGSSAQKIVAATLGGGRRNSKENKLFKTAIEEYKSGGALSNSSELKSFIIKASKKSDFLGKLEKCVSKLEDLKDKKLAKPEDSGTSRVGSHPWVDSSSSLFSILEPSRSQTGVSISETPGSSL